MKIQPLTRYSLRVMLAVAVALPLWWYSLDLVILPLSQWLAGSILSTRFAHEGLSISLSATREWVMDTRFLMEPPPYTRMLETHLKVVNVTLGLPIYWCLCAGFPGRGR